MSLLYCGVGMELDTRLANDCVVIAESSISQLLLMNKAEIPWFIIVPKTKETEFIALDTDLQHQLLEQINDVGNLLKSEFQAEKLNIATIGNIVTQMHIHIVGRCSSDFCWPNVVWGQQSSGESYSNERINEVKDKMLSFLLKRDSSDLLTFRLL